jgi:hypothetical protein
MKTIDDYAEDANRAIGRYYGQRLMFGHDLRPYVRFQDWIKAHWARYPATSPDGGKTIDNHVERPAVAPPDRLIGFGQEEAERWK